MLVINRRQCDIIDHNRTAKTVRQADIAVRSSSLPLLCTSSLLRLLCTNSLLRPSALLLHSTRVEVSDILLVGNVAVVVIDGVRYSEFVCSHFALDQQLAGY